MTQQLTVIGEPFPCDRAGCKEPAAVCLREQDNEDDIVGICYCETCWLAARAAYSPITARDVTQAIDTACAVFGNRDGGESRGVLS